jgi:TonB family protein
MTTKNILIIAVLVVSGLANAEESTRKLLERVEPELPQVAQKMDLHGTVKLKLWVSPDGTVRRLEYIGGHPLLAEAALKAAKSWKFETSAQETTETVSLKF